MKAFFLLLSLISATAFAQSQNLHMIQMSTNSAALGAFTFTDTPRTSRSLYAGANYAYKISEHVQIGVQGNYSDFRGEKTARETYSVLVGGIYNFSDDLTDAFYTSLYGGMGWSHFSGNGNYKDETVTGQFAIGKRFALKNLNLPSVTYSPEISYTRVENTQYGIGSNNYSIRFLQFSVFF